MLLHCRANGTPNLHLCFSQGCAESDAETAGDIGPLLIMANVFTEAHAPGLKQQYNGAASRAEQTFGLAAAQKHANFLGFEWCISSRIGAVAWM
jgi:hypothetical protein